MSGVGRASAVGFAIDGKGYVALGRTEMRSGALNDCWEYNPDSDKWTQKASFPGKARVKAIGLGLKGKAYVGLGYDISGRVYANNYDLKDFWCFDPKTNNWSQLADYPSKYTDACISMVFNNEIYVGFGFDGSGFSRDFWKYNPDTNVWIELNGFPGPVRIGGTMCTNGERVFFGTGFNTRNKNDWWEYFPASDSWKQMKSMPDYGRENGLSIAINNHFLVTTGRRFGGDLTVGKLYSEVMEYDPLQNNWYNRGTITGGGRENAVIFSIKGKGYVGFGENDSQVLNDFWSFEP